jgi:hypothetical protein
MAYFLLLCHDKISHTSCNHLTKVRGGLKVFLPTSKTDVFKSGKSVFLANEEEANPVYKLLFSYLNKAGLQLGQNHFLFGPMKYAHQSASFVILQDKDKTCKYC